MRRKRETCSSGFASCKPLRHEQNGALLLQNLAFLVLTINIFVVYVCKSKIRTTRHNEIVSQAPFFSFFANFSLKMH